MISKEIFERDENWLNTLPQYQKNVITDLLQLNNEKEAITIWIDSFIINTLALDKEDKKNSHVFSQKKFINYFAGI